MIIWDACHEYLDAIPIFQALEKQSGVIVLLHVVIVRLHALVPHPTLDIFVLFMWRKWVVGIGL
jgi:hypothetical protein